VSAGWIAGSLEQRWVSFGRSIKIALASRDRMSIAHYIGDLSHEDRAEILARCDLYRSKAGAR
jgi:hypothetical protein